MIRPRTVDFLAPVLFAAGLVLAEGYRLGIQTTCSFLPVIESMLGRNGLANDFNIVAHRFYHPNFTALCATLTQFLGLAPAFFVGYFLSACLMGAAIYRIARCLFESAYVASLTLLLLLVWTSQGLELNSLWYSRAFEAYFLAWPLALFGLLGYLQRRYTFCAVMLGLTTVVHFQMGAACACVFFLSMFLLRIKSEPRSILAAAAWYGLFFAFVYWQHWPVAKDLPSGKEFIEQAAFRMPHHFVFDLRKFICFSILFMTSAWMTLGGAGKYYHHENRLRHKDLIVLLSVIFFTGIVQYLDFYYFKWGFLCRLQFLRLSCLIHCVGLIYLSALVIRFMDGTDRYAKQAALVIIFIAGPFLFAIGWMQQPVFILSSCVLVALTYLVGKRIRQGSPMKEWLFYNLFLLVMLKSILSFSQSDFHFVWDQRLRVSDPWVNVCAWIRTHTPADSKFITPPYEEGFSYLAQRGMIAEFKVNPHLKFQERQWRERLEDLSGRSGFEKRCSGFGCTPWLEAGYSGLTDRNVWEIARRYQAGYFLTDARRLYPYTIIYQNMRFTLYKVARSL